MPLAGCTVCSTFFAAATAAKTQSAPGEELETVTLNEPQEQKPRINNGCDVDGVLRTYRNSDKDNEQLRDWLRNSSGAKKCNNEQLMEIREAVSWDFWGYSREVLAIIDRRLEQ